MEIEIESKRNNPLLNRTEIYFTVKHDGEGTPNREIIRSEIADKLNVDKDKVIVNTVKSSFGSQEISGYAKIYPSIAKAKGVEKGFILKRNKLIKDKAKKQEDEIEEQAKPEEKTTEKPPEEKKEQTEEVKPQTEEKKEEEPEKKVEDIPKENIKEESSETQKTEEQKEIEKEKSEQNINEKSEKTNEEKKE